MIPQVDDYINTLPSWQQDLCRRLRQLIHQADPEIQEVIKRRVLPYFVLNGNICALMGTKDHVNILIYDPNINDPAGLINQGHNNATAQAIQLYENQSFDEPAFITLVAGVAERNRAGGWRRL